jgi:arylsulfatase A-like enzyme
MRFSGARPHVADKPAKHRGNGAWGVTKPAPLFHLAIWFGLVTGLGEIVIWVIHSYVLIQKKPNLGPEQLWMVLLANILVFAVVGAILSLLARIRGRQASLPWSAFVFSTLTYASWLLPFRSLHGIAILLFTLGLASATMRLVRRYPTQCLAVLFRMVGWLPARTKAACPLTDNGEPPCALPSRRQVLLCCGSTIGGLALGMEGWRQFLENRSRSLFPAPPAQSPNVLLIVLDTVRAQNLSLYGYARDTTPALRKFAKSCTLFERAVSTAPWTLPSHASMFTGRCPGGLSAGWGTPLNDTYPTVAEMFREQGYATAGFVANLDYCCRQFGLNRGFTHYDDFPLSLGEMALCSNLVRTATDLNMARRLVNYHDELNRKPADMVNRQFLRWLDANNQRPFFAFINYFDAHSPYLPPPSFSKFGAPRGKDHYEYMRDRWLRIGQLDMQELSPMQVQAELDAYDGAIAYQDDQLANLLEDLRARDLLDNTLVIITSDHGEQFGEHRLFGHGNSLYMTLLHVPLLFRFPRRVPAGLNLSQPVSLVDLAATIVDLAELGGSVRFPGNSLARCWSGRWNRSNLSEEAILSEVEKCVSWRPWYPTSIGSVKSLIWKDFHYIQNESGQEELFDLREDGKESRNLALLPAWRRELDECRAALGRLCCDSIA